MVTESVEFGSKAEADAIRESHGKWLCSEDDRRLKTVRFSSDIPDDKLRYLEGEAAESTADRKKGLGQVPLTDAERDHIDFSKGRASVPHARTVKSVAVDEGVDDWLSYYDPTLTTSEHAQVMRDARESGGAVEGADVEETDAETRPRQHQQAKSSECDHAEDHCRHGDPDACEFLQERCGFGDDRVADILDDQEGDPAKGELPGPVYGALKGLWTQYRAGIGEAKDAAAGINEIRTQFGQDAMAFDELGEREITKESLS